MSSVNPLTLSGEQRIRALIAQHPVWLAPMAGVNDAPFRALCRRLGAGVTYTEMVSAKGLHYDEGKGGSRLLLRLDPEEVPAAVQLFGSEPEIIARQAQFVARELGDSLAFIDLNMGCPVVKVVSKGEGSALMRTPDLAAEIVISVALALRGAGVEGSDIPVTVKFRRGWDEDSANAVEFARAMEAAGASAVAVHGRYREQFYDGASEASTITEVAGAVSVPVIASGDVHTAADAVRMITSVEQGGVGADAVMIARGAMGNPWIFREAAALLATGVECASPTPTERFELMQEHARRMVAYYGDRALIRMRKHVMWYCAGLPGSSHFRGRVNHITTLEDLTALIAEYQTYLESDRG